MAMIEWWQAQEKSGCAESEAESLLSGQPDWLRRGGLKLTDSEAATNDGRTQLLLALQRIAQQHIAVRHVTFTLREHQPQATNLIVQRGNLIKRAL